MQRTKPENTKLTICVWHPFTQWRPTPAMAETLRQRWPKMNVVHLPEYKHLSGGVAGHGHFRGLFAEAGAISRRAETEMDSFDGGGRSAADVSRVARFRHRGDESQRDFFHSHGGTHDGVAAGPGAKFSRLGAPSGSFALGAARDLGSAAAPNGVEWATPADRRIRVNRQGTGAARKCI